MVRDGRLGEFERLREVADAAHLARREPAHDRHPRRVGECLEDGGEVLGRLGVQGRKVRTAAERLEDGQGFH